MISISVLGSFKVQLVNPDYQPVLARSISDLQGSLWSTAIMVYPAAMSSLYNPGSRFQKRARGTVKDAKRTRESPYLESDSVQGAVFKSNMD
jgi:hypothetical protein